MIPGSFEYFAPRSLTDAVKFLSEHKDDVKILSGGQSLLPLMKMRLSKPGYVVDIGRIPGLDYDQRRGQQLSRSARWSPTNRSNIRDLLKVEMSAAAANRDDHRRRPSAQPRHHRRQHRPRRSGRRLAGGGHRARRRDSRLSDPDGERWVKCDDFFLGLLMSVLEPDEIVTGDQSAGDRQRQDRVSESRAALLGLRRYRRRRASGGRWRRHLHPRGDRHHRRHRQSLSPRAYANRC